MSQVTWLYSDINGMDYEINIYHGDESGHILIYINDKIMQIDFGVFNSQKYTFLIDEVLFELSIDTTPGGVEYRLSGDGSPLENKPTARDFPHPKSKHTGILVIFVLAFLLLLLLLYLIIF